MKLLISKVSIIVGAVALNMGMVSPLYAGIDDTAKGMGQMIGRFKSISTGMCKQFPTPHMNKLVKANDKLFGGRSWTVKNRYKIGKEEGYAEWNLVEANLKKKDPKGFSNKSKLKKQCVGMDKAANKQYEQFAMLGFYN
ncbi:MAG: hypothetical protein QM500_13090 [Methylococcales bacterium]